MAKPFPPLAAPHPQPYPHPRSRSLTLSLPQISLPWLEIGLTVLGIALLRMG